VAAWKLTAAHPASPLPLPFAANPPRNCTGKQLGYEWAKPPRNSSYYRLKIPKLSGYDACCQACQDDYGCKRFVGGARSCTLLFDAPDATLVPGPSDSFVGVMVASK
jgi:hypothetical protein